MLSFQLEMWKQYAKDRLNPQSELGAVTIEYGVITVFIALALIAVVGVLVGGIDTWFKKIVTFLSGQPGGPSSS